MECGYGTAAQAQGTITFNLTNSTGMRVINAGCAPFLS